jgi:hypothetical protein
MYSMAWLERGTKIGVLNVCVCVCVCVNGGNRSGEEYTFLLVAGSFYHVNHGEEASFVGELELYIHFLVHV